MGPEMGISESRCNTPPEMFRERMIHSKHENRSKNRAPTVYGDRNLQQERG